MIIVAGGDSFVFGSELKDCGPGYSSRTFPALLAKTSKRDYLCAAWPGYGNDAIARSVMQACEQVHACDRVVIVSWTFPGRYEFRFGYNTGQKGSPWYSINAWTIKDNANEIEQEFVTKNKDVLDAQLESIRKAKETGVANFAKTFYAHVGSTEYWEIYSSLKEIVFLQNYLKLNNIPYLFTCADNSIMFNHTIEQRDSTIDSLYSQIDFKQWFWFPEGKESWETTKPRGFYQWALENKYPVGTTHPLEQAHIDAAKLMQEKFNAMVKKPL